MSMSSCPQRDCGSRGDPHMLIMRSMVEGLARSLSGLVSPSVSPASCHLPVPGRIDA